MEFLQLHKFTELNGARLREQTRRLAVRLNAITTRWHPCCTLPNLLTGSRFIIAPSLLYLAWFDHAYFYIALLSLSFFSDLIDGSVARLLHLQSALGAALDTWSDFVVYITVPLTAWWLWPRLVEQELFYAFLIIFGFTVPPLIGLFKFRTVPSYHTWGAKLAAASVGSSMVLMVVVGPVLPFRLAAALSVIAALEEIAITLVLQTARTDVRSLWHVLSTGRT